MTNQPPNPYQQWMSQAGDQLANLYGGGHQWMPSAGYPSADPFMMLRGILIMVEQVYNQLVSDGVLPGQPQSGYQTPAGLPPIPPVAPMVQPQPSQESAFGATHHGGVQSPVPRQPSADDRSGKAAPERTQTAHPTVPFQRSLWPHEASVDVLPQTSSDSAVDLDDHPGAHHRHLPALNMSSSANDTELANAVAFLNGGGGATGGVIGSGLRSLQALNQVGSAPLDAPTLPTIRTEEERAT